MGEQFYLTGRTADGVSVAAVVQGDLVVRSTDMPCANCHRRSGWGGAEATITVPPVTNAALYAPVTRGGREMGTLRTTGAGTRPAYTDETLVRAIREGIDPSGRTLSATMPRYALGDRDAEALVSHLRSLSASPPPGVTETSVHLATVTTATVPSQDRDAMLDVFRAYVRDKNAGTRNESQRRDRGPWDMKQRNAIYREWSLHEWTLTGSPETWSTQLESLYRDRPVFAIVGGIATEDWSIVHAFAEEHRLPVILPQTPLPADTSSGPAFYTLYLSRGVAFEADVLIERLAHDAASEVVQISTCGTPGEAAAARMRTKSPKGVSVTGTCVERDAPLDSAWTGLDIVNTVVLWLGPDDLAAVLSTLPEAARDVFVSGTLLNGDLSPLSEFANPSNASNPDPRKLFALYPYVPPADFDRHSARALTWLNARGLTARSRIVAVNTLYAATLTADALSTPRVLDSREYFVERIEAMAARSPNKSAYPENLFNANRRVGSAGSYLLQLLPTPDVSYRKVGAWFVPD